MESPKFPREEGFRYFLHTLGRRYANPYPAGEEDHALYAAGWRQAALICGQAHLARMESGSLAGTAPGASPSPAGMPGSGVLPAAYAAQGALHAAG